MKRTLSQTILAGLLAGSMIAPLAGTMIAPAFAQSNDDGIEYQSPRKQLAVGTQVKVKLLQDLNSTSAQTGDKVRVEVAGDDTSGLPAGTIFNGRVASVKPATPKTAGVLRVRFGANHGSSSPYSTTSTASVLLTGTKPTQGPFQLHQRRRRCWGLTWFHSQAQTRRCHRRRGSRRRGRLRREPVDQEVRQ